MTALEILKKELIGKTLIMFEEYWQHEGEKHRLFLTFSQRQYEEENINRTTNTIELEILDVRESSKQNIHGTQFEFVTNHPSSTHHFYYWSNFTLK